MSHGLQDVKDNHEEAAKVAPQTLQLCMMVSSVMQGGGLSSMATGFELINACRAVVTEAAHVLLY